MIMPLQDILDTPSKITKLLILKAKAIPVTGREGPWGYETSRLSYFLDNRLTAVRLSSSRTGRPLPPGRFLALISIRGRVDRKAIT
jgi:hypothetical protein